MKWCWRSAPLVLLVLGLTVLMLSSAALAEATQDSQEPIIFPTITDPEDKYYGLPLFTGNPEHLEAYLEAYLDYIGLDGIVKYALDQRNDYQLRDHAVFADTLSAENSALQDLLGGKRIEWEQPNAGRWIPGTANFSEGMLGAYNMASGYFATEFGQQASMAQTFNKELNYQIGRIQGLERLNNIEYDGGSPEGANNSYMSAINFMHTFAGQDLRVTPLSGRINNDYGEDPYLAAVIADVASRGATGISDVKGNDLPGNPGGFYQRVFVESKHFTNYVATFLRTTGSNTVTARAMGEFQSATLNKAIESGAISGVMTSYGRTNGIPNAISPMLKYLKDRSKYGVYTLSDNGAEVRMFAPNAFGNGYEDRYTTSRLDQILWQFIAGNSAGHQQATSASATNYPANTAGNNASGGAIHENHMAVIWAVQDGRYAITLDDLKAIARDQIMVLIRQGILNVRDENNIPTDYPFRNTIYQATGQPRSAIYNASTPGHQEVALQLAQESVVLLKNDRDTLPISKDADIVITGYAADIRSKAQYAVPTRGANAANGGGLSALGGIAAVREDIKSSSDARAKALEYIQDGTYVAGEKVIRIKADNGKYLVVDAVGEDIIVRAIGDTPEEATLFEVIASGQGDSVQYRVTGETGARADLNGRLLQIGDRGLLTNNTTDVAGFHASAQPADPPDGARGPSDTFYASNAGTPQSFFQREYQSDGRVRLLGGANGGGTMRASTETSYYTAARYLMLLDYQAGTIGQSDILGSGDGTPAENAGAKRTASTLFTEEVAFEAGASVPDDGDYAIVVVGTPWNNHFQRYGTDRIDLDLGREQYELVENVAEKYPGRTIVVVRNIDPVNLQPVKDNPKVGAIIYQNYAGAYDGYALAQAILGEVNPSGRLSRTWYAGIETFPEISQYSIGEGTGISFEELSPFIRVDTTLGCPSTAKMTYMYDDQSNVTYPFGYGLSYGYDNVEYRGPLNAPAVVSANDGPFSLTIQVGSTGASRGDIYEVVQLYVREKNPVYGEASPKKRLVAFEKVYVHPTEDPQTVVLTVDPKDLALWDVTADKKTVFSGEYEFIVGRHSEDERFTATVKIIGEEPSVVDATKPVDIFARSFAAHEVVYREVSRQGTMASHKEGTIMQGYYAVMSKTEGAWVALKNIDLTGHKKISMSVAAKDQGGRIQVRLGAPDGKLLAVVDVPKTDPVQYNLWNTEVLVTELGYVDVEADFTAVDGAHDIYLVFAAPDLRAATFTLSGAER